MRLLIELVVGVGLNVVLRILSELIERINALQGEESTGFLSPVLSCRQRENEIRERQRTMIP